MSTSLTLAACTTEFRWLFVAAGLIELATEKTIRGYRKKAVAISYPNIMVCHRYLQQSLATQTSWYAIRTYSSRLLPKNHGNHSFLQ